MAIFFFLLTYGTAAGQEQTHFTNFFLNPYSLNSSYAGLDGQPSVSFLYRKQWMTIDGAPTISNLSFHAPVNERVSAGVSISNDAKSFFNTSTLLFSAAYHVPLQIHSFLRFGLSLGGSWNTVDMKKLETVNDPALSNVIDKNASLAGNAGVSFHYRTFNIGIALPSIFSPVLVSEDAFNVREVKPFQSATIHAANRFYFNDNRNVFEPYVLYHLNQAWPAQFELAGIVHLNHILWAGGSYKQYFGVSALGGIKLKQILAIGASYSLPQSHVDELNSPTFEVSINYLFGKHTRNAPVYSFVNDVKPKEKAVKRPASGALTARQKQVQAEQNRRAEAAKARAEQDEKRRVEAAKLKAEQEENRKRLAAESEAKRQASDQQRKKAAEDRLKAAELAAQQQAKGVQKQEKAEQSVHVDSTVSPPSVEPEGLELHSEDELDRVADIADGQSLHEEQSHTGEQGDQLAADDKSAVAEFDLEGDREQLERLENSDDDPQRLVEPAVSDHVRHETAKHGNDPQELAPGEYVVAGAFKSVDNATRFSDGLRNLSYKSNQGYVTEKGLWYVYILKTNNLQTAEVEQRKVSKLFLLRDAWLLTVE